MRAPVHLPALAQIEYSIAAWRWISSAKLCLRFLLRNPELTSCVHVHLWLPAVRRMRREGGSNLPAFPDDSYPSTVRTSRGFCAPPALYRSFATARGIFRVHSASLATSSAHPYVLPSVFQQSTGKRVSAEYCQACFNRVLPSVFQQSTAKCVSAEYCQMTRISTCRLQG